MQRSVVLYAITFLELILTSGFRDRVNRLSTATALISQRLKRMNICIKFLSCNGGQIASEIKKRKSIMPLKFHLVKINIKNSR